MSGDRLRDRAPREVLDDHLRLREAGELERDLERNVSPEIVILTSSGVWRGHEGVREQARALRRYAPEARFDYESVVLEGELAYLEWSAPADGSRVHDGADSYLIRDGWIVAQTIHYTARDG